ncbi:MAG: NADPH-dependent F420 reductase [Hyphomicrobiaceae bacterium]|nr:NADPH-dependent F420 reductase [Hyphomicrobiaceae bacterium]
MDDVLNGQVIAVIGGTGALGSGLAQRLAAAGKTVIIGSRTADKAQAAAQTLKVPAGAPPARGMTNADAAAAATVAVVTVPWGSQAEILAEIKPHVAGKLVVDCTVPLAPPKVARVNVPAEHSAALAAQQRLGSGVRVVSGFHNVAAHKLATDASIDCDVLVFGDEPKDRDVAIAIATAAGLRGVHAGPLANSIAAEAMTSVLIGINRNYKADGAGLRITSIKV